MKTGIPSHDGHQGKQNKGRSKPDNSGWFGNPVSLIAMCATVLALVTAVIFNVHDSETANTGDYVSLRTTGDITPGPASGTATGADETLASNGDESEPQTLAGSAANPFQNIGLLQPSPAAVVADDDAAEDADADETEHPAGVGNYSDAQNAEWRGQLYAQLNSLEPPAAGAEDTSPVIAGRVLTRSGRPVSEIEVSAQLRQYFKTADDDASARATGDLRTTTNSNGFYAFRDLPEGIFLIGTRESSGYAPARIEVLTGVKYADLVLESRQIAQVSGIVTDTMGTELDGVRIMPLVKGIPEGAVSNNDGEFEFDVALQGETRNFPVRFQLEGYREQRYQVSENDWTEDGLLEFVVAMEPVYDFSTVSGSLADTASNQITGETVRLYSPSLKRNYRAVSDAGGAFLFAKVEVADDYQLWIRPTGPYRDFTEQNLQLSQGSVHRDIELESLDRNYRLSGRILDQNGKPVPEFTLTLHSKAATGQRLPVTSTKSGDFVVENVPEGELVIESLTMPYYTLSGLHLSGDEKDHHVTLVVNRGRHKLLGKVMDSDGRSVATPRVSIASTQVINGIRSRSSSSTSADARGHFLFTDLGAGEHTVTVNAPGYDGVRLQPVVGMQNELVVRLEKSST